MSGGWITQADRARWQHQAALALAALAAWRQALGLEDYREWPGGGGTARLYAAGTRGEVKIRISASVFEEQAR